MGLTRILEQPYQNPKFPSEAFFEGLLWRVISPSTQIIWWQIIYPWKALWVSYLTHFVSPHSEFGRRSYAHFRKVRPAENANSSSYFYCSLLFTRPIIFSKCWTILPNDLYYFLGTISSIHFSKTFPSLLKYFSPLKKKKNLGLGLGFKAFFIKFLQDHSKGMVILHLGLAFTLESIQS